MIEVLNELKPERQVLIVDDAFDVRVMLKEILKLHPIESIDEAARLKEAETKLNHFDYQLIFMDIQLNEDNGLEALKQIKRANPHSKVVMISAYSTADNVRQALISGADGFIVKPFTIKKVENILKKVGLT
ncbi:MAG: response regulator [Gammaproteobacteria bacterium]|nr:response regulator [Gammaproteobacteria bacterium]